MPPKVSKKTAKKAPGRKRTAVPADPPDPPDPPDWDSLLIASTHDVRRLDSVIRFSSIPVTFSESTACHSFWVSLYSLMIWQHLAASLHKVPSLEEVLRQAIVHDLPEAIGGDVVRTLKYSTPEMKREVDRAEGILAKKLFPREVKRTMDFVPGRDVLAIVKAADFLSLWQFMRREAARKNLEIMPYFQRMVGDLKVKAKEEHPLVGGLYWSMYHEAKQVANDCFGDLDFSKRWYREMP